MERRSYWQIVGRQKSTGVVFLEFYWRLSPAGAMFVFLEFYSWKSSEAVVVFLEVYWRPCEPAGSVPRSLWVRFGRAGVLFLQFYWRLCEPAASVARSFWVRFGRFGGRQEREIECKEETLTRL